MAYKATPVQNRVRRYFTETEGCWLWTGYLDRDGYGQIWINETKTNKRAHRAVYEALVGEIPMGLTLDHLCEVRNCVNPAHLKPATVRENTLRSNNARAAQNYRKVFCKRGHKFTPDNTYRPPGRPSERHCKQCKKERYLWLQKS